MISKNYIYPFVKLFAWLGAFIVATRFTHSGSPFDLTVYSWFTLGLPYFFLHHVSMPAWVSYSGIVFYMGHFICFMLAQKRLWIIALFGILILALGCNVAGCHRLNSTIQIE